MIRVMPIVLLAVALAAPPVAAQGLVALARPDVNILASVRVADFASSPLVTMFWNRARAEQPEFDQLLSVMGPNPLSMIDEVVIGGSLDASQTEEPEGLLLAQGRFEETLVVSALCPKGCETSLYEGFEIRRPLGDDDDKHFVMMDGNRIALGNLEEIQGVVARRLSGASTRFGAGMSDWIQRLGGHHIWIAAAGPFPQPENDSDNAFAPLGNFSSKIDGFGVGIDITHDIDMSFDVRAATQQDARQFYDLLNGFIAMAKANEQKPETLETLNNIRLTQDGNVLAASFRLTGEEIRRQMAERAASGGSGVAPAQRAPAAPASSRPNVVIQPAPKRRSGGIRIYGLGDETVEVPTTKGAGIE